MKFEKLLRIFLIIISIYITVSSILNIQITEKIPFNQSNAEKVLKETYKPLDEFVRNLVFMENGQLLRIKDSIKNKKDFAARFAKMDEHNGKSIYEDLIIEREGKLYVDPLIFIPNIHDESGVVADAYIKKRKNLRSKLIGGHGEEGEELVIYERWMISGDWHSRRNYFEMNDNGEWILDHANGTSCYGFTRISHNPWSKYWGNFRETGEAMN